MAQASKAKLHEEPRVEEAPVPESPPAKVHPLYSKEGVLLNPGDCVVGADGVVVAK